MNMASTSPPITLLLLCVNYMVSYKPKHLFYFFYWSVLEGFLVVP